MARSNPRSVKEYAAGYGVQLGRTGFAKVDYIYRKWQDFYGLTVTQGTGTITDPLGLVHDRGIIGNTNDIERNYRGLQFQAGIRPSRFNLGVSYTYSKLRGNDETETATSGAFANLPLNSYYPEYASYARRLPNGYIDNFDQRHQLKAWAGYDVPMPSAFGNLNVTVLHSFHSGIAYSAKGLINVTNYTGAPNIPAYEQSLLGTQFYYFSDRGALRTDDINRTDLALNYVFPIGKVQLFATGELLNVFNNDGLEDLNFIQQAVRTNANSNCLQGSNGPTPGARCLRFNPFTDTPVQGINYQLAPGFGTATNSRHISYRGRIASRREFGSKSRTEIMHEAPAARPGLFFAAPARGHPRARPGEGLAFQFDHFAPDEDESALVLHRRAPSFSPRASSVLPLPGTRRGWDWPSPSDPAFHSFRVDLL